MAETRELRDDRTKEQIEKRAYEIYLRRHGEGGHALDDWLMAEEELRQERRR